MSSRTAIRDVTEQSPCGFDTTSGSWAIDLADGSSVAVREVTLTQTELVFRDRDGSVTSLPKGAVREFRSVSHVRGAAMGVLYGGVIPGALVAVAGGALVGVVGGLAGLLIGAINGYEEKCVVSGAAADPVLLASHFSRAGTIAVIRPAAPDTTGQDAPRINPRPPDSTSNVRATPRVVPSYAMDIASARRSKKIEVLVDVSWSSHGLADAIESALKDAGYGAHRPGDCNDFFGCSAGQQYPDTDSAPGFSVTAKYAVRDHVLVGMVYVSGANTSATGYHSFTDGWGRAQGTYADLDVGCRSIGAGAWLRKSVFSVGTAVLGSECHLNNSAPHVENPVSRRPGLLLDAGISTSERQTVYGRIGVRAVLVGSRRTSFTGGDEPSSRASINLNSISLGFGLGVRH